MIVKALSNPGITMLRHNNNNNKQFMLQQEGDWYFSLPGQGTLAIDQEDKLRLDFLVTPDQLGTVSAPLIVSIEV